MGGTPRDSPGMPHSEDLDLDPSSLFHLPAESWPLVRRPPPVALGENHFKILPFSVVQDYLQ